MLLQTIKVPKNILYLTDRLPKPKYGDSSSSWGNERERKMNEEEQLRRKTHDAQGMLPEIKKKPTNTDVKKPIKKVPVGAAK